MSAEIDTDHEKTGEGGRGVVRSAGHPSEQQYMRALMGLWMHDEMHDEMHDASYVTW
jgi:hypothetical protein